MFWQICELQINSFKYVFSFHSLKVSITNLKKLIKLNLTIFNLWFTFEVASKNSLPNPSSQKLSPIYFFRFFFLRWLNIQVNLAGLLDPWTLNLIYGFRSCFWGWASKEKCFIHSRAWDFLALSPFTGQFNCLGTFSLHIKSCKHKTLYKDIMTTTFFLIISILWTSVLLAQ